MPKGSLETTSVATGGQPVRDMLRQLEISLASLKRRQVDVEQLLLQRDAVEEALARAQEQGLDVRPERARAVTIDGLLRNQARRLMRLLADEGGFAAARARHDPPEERWWWYLDVRTREQTVRSLRRSALIVGGILASLLIVNTVLTHFWGPSPERSAFNDLTGQAEQQLSRGMLAEAATSYEQALAIIPEDTEIRCRLGVLYELQGRGQASADAFAAAEQHSERRDLFLFDQTRAYLMLGQQDRALELATAAVTEFDQSPYTFFVFGEALQAKGETSAAAQAFNIAAILAAEQDETVLVALARERQAMLISGGR